MTKLYLFSPA